MSLWYEPNPVPYRPHPASWRQPLHLHLAPLWAALARVLPTLRGRVVDVGCGAKPYRGLLHPAVTDYVGVDRPGPHATPDVEADAHALPFPDGSFDAGVSFQVFEHVERPAQCVAESDFQTLVADPGAGMKLFFAGKLKVKGNQMLAMNLTKLFNLLK